MALLLAVGLFSLLFYLMPNVKDRAGMALSKLHSFSAMSLPMWPKNCFPIGNLSPPQIRKLVGGDSCVSSTTTDFT